jgi:hypothetical protein
MMTIDGPGIRWATSGIRWALWCGLCALAVTLSCRDASKDDAAAATDTKTNWLEACDRDAQCDSEFACLCGVCTLACDATPDCDSIGEQAVCEPSETCDDAPAICQRAAASTR